MDNILGYYLMPHMLEIIYEIADSNTHRLMKISEACDEIGKEISRIEPDTIVVLSSHGNLKEKSFAISMGEDIYGDFEEFRNEDIRCRVELDNAISQGIIDYFNSNSTNCIINNNDNKLNHGVMVPLYFVNKYYKNYKLVTISSTIKDTYKLFELGKAIRDVCDMLEKNIVIIASCDAKINRELSIIHRNLHKNEIDKRVAKFNSDFNVFKYYNTESKRFRELQKYGECYFSFINGALGKREISGMFLASEELFDTEYTVTKLKTK